MTLALVGVAAIVVAAVLIRMAMTSRRSGPTRAEIDRGQPERWLSEAGTVVRDGRQLASELEAPVAAFELDPMVHVPSELEQRVEALTRALAELTTTAPTRMDVRVCRGLSIRTRALGDAISAVDDSDAQLGRAPMDRRELAGRHAAFVAALSDLEAHVDLI